HDLVRLALHAARDVPVDGRDADSVRLHLRRHAGRRRAARRALGPGRAALCAGARVRIRRALRRHRECFAMSASVILILASCLFLAIGVPVAFALGLATALTLVFAESYPLFVLLKE